MFLHLQSTIDDAQRAAVEAAARALGLRLVEQDPVTHLVELRPEGVPAP